MTREPPILSNKKRTLRSVLPYFCLLCVFMAAAFWLGKTWGQTVIFVSPENEYSFAAQSVVFIVLFVLLLAAVAVVFFSVLEAPGSYIELYRDRVYILPVKLFCIPFLLEGLLDRREEQPQVFTYEEIDDIKCMGRGACLVVCGKNGGHYICYTGRKFGRKVVAEFQARKEGR